MPGGHITRAEAPAMITPDHRLHPDIALDPVLDAREDHDQRLPLALLEQLVELVPEALPRGEHEAQVDQDEDRRLRGCDPRSRRRP